MGDQGPYGMQPSQGLEHPSSDTRGEEKEHGPLLHENGKEEGVERFDPLRSLNEEQKEALEEMRAKMGKHITTEEEREWCDDIGGTVENASGRW